jgi:hypothetical protein
METCLLPGGKEPINTIPAVKTDHETVVLEHPVHLSACGQDKPGHNILYTSAEITDCMAPRVLCQEG